ncbi:amidase chyE [Apiospora marii]|uniref:Amidase chyE n=1 Tax=Apiospora marii TaxID=335849 RepID=A0ABR1R791_9PEZI
MCGISVVVKLNRAAPNNEAAGEVAQNHTNGDAKLELEKRLLASLEQIAHRGPDAQGVWVDPTSQIGLGHCRLSINDLTPDGSQPLHDDSGHVHAVINGEIYDHERLRAECIRECGYQFRGHSDSEVVVALYRRYGAPEFLRHMRGEFSLVLYDDRTGDVIAAKDRFGIKPLFWTMSEEGVNDSARELWIAAEMKAFLPLGWKPEWDAKAIALDTWALVSNTAFKGVKRVEPGWYMTVSPDGTIKHEQYWEFDYPDKKQVETRSMEEMIQQVREKAIEAVRLRLHADVPVGIYLSGGLDSSTVAGITKHLVEEGGESMGSQKPTDRIACFCVKFGTDSGFDESEIAQRTADHLGVQMHTIDMTEADFARHFEDTVWHNEQVTCDLNTVGKWALSKLPRDLGFKVILSGEGADEVFAGYHWFLGDFLLEADHSRPQDPLQQAPELRQALHEQVRSHVRDKDRNLGTAITTARTLDGQGSEGQSGEKDGELPGQEGFVPYLVSFGMMDADMLHPTLRPLCDERARSRAVMESWSATALSNIRDKWHPLHSSLYSWNKKQLPAMILTIHRGPPPFLDHHLVELVNGMPPSVKERFQPPSESQQDSNGNAPAGFGLQSGSSAWWRSEHDTDKDGDGSASNSNGSNANVFSLFWEKWILREAAKPFITDELYRRRKHPYTAPVTWPRDGPLQQMLRRLLTKENVDAVGFLDWPAIAQSLEAGFAGKEERADPIALRRCLLAAGYVVIAQRFHVATAVLD